MADTNEEAQTGSDPTKTQAKAELMPVLAGLDTIATKLEETAAAGGEITPTQVTTYEVQAHHARHLLISNDLTPCEVRDAEREHHGDGTRGFTKRGLDHATHVRHFAPAPDHKEEPTDEEIDQ